MFSKNVLVSLLFVFRLSCSVSISKFLLSLHFFTFWGNWKPQYEAALHFLLLPKPQSQTGPLLLNIVISCFQWLWIQIWLWFVWCFDFVGFGSFWWFRYLIVGLLPPKDLMVLDLQTCAKDWCEHKIDLQKDNSSELLKHETNKVYQQQQKQKQQTKQDQWSLAMRWPGLWNHHATLLMYLWSPVHHNEDCADCDESCDDCKWE